MNIFETHQKGPPAGPVEQPPLEMTSSVGDLSRRIRLLEERHTTLRKNLQVVEQNMISDSKRLFSEMRTLNSELTDLRHDFSELKEQLKLVIAELKDCAKKEQIMVLEKYINLWEPLHFVTRKEVDRLVERKLAEHLQK